MNLKEKIESLLFVSDRPVSAKALQQVLNTPESEIQAALNQLLNEKQNSGILLLENNGRYLLSTNPENSNLVKEFLNAELREKLSDASLEALAIIAYKQPVSRAEIESIRGVNSQYTIRLLMMRGLIEKTSGPDKRSNYYRTTHEFLQHLGLSSNKDLPDFEELTAKINPPEGFTQPETNK